MVYRPAPPAPPPAPPTRDDPASGTSCPYCRSYDTKIKGLICSQIVCTECGARGPKVYPTGGYPLAEFRAAMFWRPAPAPPVCQPGDPRNSPGFKPPVPRREWTV